MVKMKLPKSEVVAFDPGRKTGVVDVKDGEIVVALTIEYEDLKRRAPENFVRTIGVADHAVVEAFTMYDWSQPKDANLWWPIAATALIDLEAAKAGKELQRLAASDVKNFATNKRLKEHGWWDMLQDAHQKDAARLALFKLYNLER